MITKIRMAGHYVAKQAARERLYAETGYTVTLDQIADPSCLNLGGIDHLVKSGGDLNFERAYGGMLIVLSATNSLIAAAVRAQVPELPDDEALKYQAASFLQLMATKEALVGLTAAEVAGFVAATMHDVVPLRLTDETIVETCGMGGDRGMEKNGVTYKTINVSTLVSLVLATLGYPVIKHGSYGNTTRVGSTDAMDQFGVQTTQTSLAEVERLFARWRYWYADAHNTKTVHDISHLLRHETINHVIGPMTLPVSRGQPFHKIMGVNEKVEALVIAQAYEKLVSLGHLQLLNGVIIAGRDWEKPSKFVLDELSPTNSQVVFIHQGKVVEDAVVRPADFGVKLSWDDILVDSDPCSVHHANQQAIRADSPSLLQPYLAMNAALAVFVASDLTPLGLRGGSGRLRERYQECLDVLRSGAVQEFLDNYRHETSPVLI